MNPILEVLKTTISTDLCKYSFLKYHTDTSIKNVLSIYFKNIRLVLTNIEIVLYKFNEELDLYETIHKNDTGLDDDEYFNLSLNYELNDICKKENIDKLREIMDNMKNGMHIIEVSNKK